MLHWIDLFLKKTALYKPCGMPLYMHADTRIVYRDSTADALRPFCLMQGSFSKMQKSPFLISKQCHVMHVVSVVINLTPL